MYEGTLNARHVKITLPKAPAGMAFSGGGAKGVGYFGTLRALEKQNNGVKYLQQVVGVSVGSITASLVACGLSPDEVAEIPFDPQVIAPRILQNSTDNIAKLINDRVKKNFVKLHSELAALRRKDNFESIIADPRERTILVGLIDKCGEWAACERRFKDALPNRPQGTARSMIQQNDKEQESLMYLLLKVAQAPGKKNNPLVSALSKAKGSARLRYEREAKKHIRTAVCSELGVAERRQLMFLLSQIYPALRENLEKKLKAAVEKALRGKIDLKRGNNFNLVNLLLGMGQSEATNRELLRSFLITNKIKLKEHKQNALIDSLLKTSASVRAQCEENEMMDCILGLMQRKLVSGPSQETLMDLLYKMNSSAWGKHQGTFGELEALRKAIPGAHLKKLKVIGTLAEDHSEIIFSADTTRDVPIAQACAASAALPIFFKQSKIDVATAFGVTQGQVATEKEMQGTRKRLNRQVDGGVVDNCGFRYLDGLDTTRKMQLIFKDYEQYCKFKPASKETVIKQFFAKVAVDGWTGWNLLLGDKRYAPNALTEILFLSYQEKHEASCFHLVHHGEVGMRDFAKANDPRIRKDLVHEETAGFAKHLENIKARTIEGSIPQVFWQMSDDDVQYLLAGENDLGAGAGIGIDVDTKGKLREHAVARLELQKLVYSAEVRRVEGQAAGDTKFKSELMDARAARAKGALLKTMLRKTPDEQKYLINFMQQKKPIVLAKLSYYIGELAKEDGMLAQGALALKADIDELVSREEFARKERNILREVTETLYQLRDGKNPAFKALLAVADVMFKLTTAVDDKNKDKNFRSVYARVHKMFLEMTPEKNRKYKITINKKDSVQSKIRTAMALQTDVNSLVAASNRIAGVFSADVLKAFAETQKDALKKLSKNEKTAVDKELKAHDISLSVLQSASKQVAKENEDNGAATFIQRFRV